MGKITKLPTAASQPVKNKPATRSRGNVEILPVVTYLDRPVGRILNMTRDAKCSELVTIGYDKDGEFFFASSKSSGGDVLWLLEQCKKKLLEVAP